MNIIVLFFLIISNYLEVPSWSWLYGSWIYNYICNQCLSTIKLVSSNPTQGVMYFVQHYVIKFVSELSQVGGFLRVLRFALPIKLTDTL
jgi:hypothetical protein